LGRYETRLDERAVPITVVARWHVSAQDLEWLLAQMPELRQRTLAEPGCLGYDVFRSVTGAGELLLLERYTDDDAIAAHRRSAHYQEMVVKRILPIVSDRKVELLRAIEDT